LFGAVLQRKPEVAEPGPEDLHEVGCVSRLSKMVKFPDGTVRVLVEGLWRIRLKEFEPPAPYLRAHYELLRDETEDSIELQAMLRNAHKQFEEIAKMSTALTDQVKIAALNTEHPGHFADLIAANLNLSLEDRQKLLEMVSVRERLQSLLPMLNREQEVLTLSSKIQSDVASSIAKTSAIFSCANKCAPSSANWATATQRATKPSRSAKKSKGRFAGRSRKAAEQELERLAANAARRRRIRRRAQLSRLDSEPAVGKIHRGQTGSEGGGKNPERTAFRPRKKSRTGCWNFSPSSNAASKSKARSFVSSARPASAKPPSAKASPTRSAENSPHFPGRHARRSGNPRPSPHLCRRDARPDHSNLAPRRKPQPGHFAG
jgi:Lon protease-like protein